MSVHELLVVVHATAATVGLLAAAVVFAVGRGVRVHAVAVVTMAASLIGAVVVESRQRTAAATTLFGGLCAIAVVMAVQAVLAVRRARRAGYLDDRCLRAVGFSVIGLLTGFVAVSLSRVTQSAVALVGAPLLTVGLGRALLELAVRARRSRPRRG